MTFCWWLQNLNYSYLLFSSYGYTSYVDHHQLELETNVSLNGTYRYCTQYIWNSGVVSLFWTWCRALNLGCIWEIFLLDLFLFLAGDVASRKYTWLAITWILHLSPPVVAILICVFSLFIIVIIRFIYSTTIVNVWMWLQPKSCLKELKLNWNPCQNYSFGKFELTFLKGFELFSEKICFTRQNKLNVHILF